jgi:hypothetical protein
LKQWTKEDESPKKLFSLKTVSLPGDSVALCPSLITPIKRELKGTASELRKQRNTLCNAATALWRMAGER